MTLPEKFSYIQMHDDLALALDALFTTQDNLFITGAGGCGKTEFIKLCSDRSFYNKNVVVCTPTGISAVNASSEGVRATTLYSFLRLPPLSIIPVDKLTIRSDLAPVVQAMDTLIIDEISMVNADLLTKINALINMYRKGKNPVRYIFLGDPSQLAPVVQSRDEQEFLEDMYGSRFFFDSEVFQDVRTIEFRKIFRQKDEDFVKLLNKFRFNAIDKTVLDLVNSRYMDEEDFRKQGEYVYIAMTNKRVNEINAEKVSENYNTPRVYYGQVEGGFPEKDMIVPAVLQLKKGVQVLVCANNHKIGYYNGMLGEVVDMRDNNVVISTSTGEYTIEPYEWHKYNYKYDRDSKKIAANPSGRYRQLPLKVAYALTAHKTQGLTLDRVYLDIENGTFASGQLYVALSRVRTFEGLGLAKRLNKRDNKLNAKVKKFYKKNKIKE